MPKGSFDKALDQINQIDVLAPGGRKALWAKLHLAYHQLEHNRSRNDALKLLRQVAEEYSNSEEGYEAMKMLERFERHGKEMNHGR